MDSVSKLTRLLETLRLQQTGNKRSNNTTAPTASKRPAIQTGITGVQQNNQGLDQLNRRISERINRLPPEERQGDKAVQLFVDSVLSWKFSEELLQTGSFLRYSKLVRAAINSDPDLNLEFKQLLKSLAQN